MAAIIRSSQATNSGSATSTSFTPVLPTGRASGDLLIAAVASSTAAIPTRPGTYTSIRSIPDSAFHLDICSLTEAGGVAVAWSKATACKWAAIILCIQTGTWDTVTPIDVENGAANGATSVTSYSSPSITTTIDDDLLVAVFANKAASTWTNADTAPPMLEAGDTTSTGTSPASISLYHSGINAVAMGAYIRTGVASLSNAEGCAWLGAFRPNAAFPSGKWKGLPVGTRRSAQHISAASW